MSSQLVSAIIPAYNASATLQRTLRSIANQTYENIEILIVDDGSTDDTADIARSFCAAHPRAKFIQQRNAGVAKARNTGIEHARGEWIAPVDADDVWQPTKIERQIEAALNAPEMPGFVYCWFHVIDEADQVIGSSEAYHVRGHAVDPLLYFNFVGNGSSLLIRRDAAVNAGGYEERLAGRGLQGCEDFALQLSLARDYPIEVAPQFLVGYRLMPGSMSQNRERMYRSWQLALKLFEEDGGAVNRKCLRRNAAYRALRSAAELTGKGAKGDSIRLITRALLLDPGRTSAKLGYRLAKSVRRRVAAPLPSVPKPSFWAAPLNVQVGTDRYEIPFLSAALKGLDQRRLKNLAGAGR